MNQTIRWDLLKKAALLLAAARAALYGSPAKAEDPQPVTVLVVYHSATGKPTRS